MKRCKQLGFTGKIYVDENKNVYTNDISAIFSGREIEKDTEVSLESNVVRVRRLYSWPSQEAGYKSFSPGYCFRVGQELENHQYLPLKIPDTRSGNFNGAG